MARTIRRRDFLKAVGGAIGFAGLASVGACAPAAAPSPTATTAPKPAPAAQATPQAAAPPPAKTAPLKFTLGATAVGLGGVLPVIMRDRKITEKYNIDPDVKTFTAADASAAFLNKVLDVSFLGVVETFRVWEQGKTIQLFQPIQANHTSIVALKGAPYKHIKDLRGKKIGSLGRTSSVYQDLMLVTKVMGLELEKDFQVVFGDNLLLEGLLQKKEIDAATLVEPRASITIAQGVFDEVTTTRGIWQELTGEKLFTLGYGAWKDWIAKNQDAVKRIARAIEETQNVLISEPKAYQDYAKFFGFEKPEEIALAGKRIPDLFVPKWTPKILENIELTAKRMVEFKLLEKMPPIGDIILQV
ncbi:MAG: ABC transporter substrate-binding protein [Chloroflexi bacterium]|nr:ABC transporter substrate-binding protein [Chloroflexota bacterium]